MKKLLPLLLFIPIPASAQGIPGLGSAKVIEQGYPQQDTVLRIWPVLNDGTFTIYITPAGDKHQQIIVTNAAEQAINNTVPNKTVEICLDLLPCTDKVQINISNFPGGVYFVMINGITVRKFVKD